MGLKFLDGRRWSDITREERFFCQRLYQLICSRGAAGFISCVNGVVGTDLPESVEWEPAFEACFYRDLWTYRGRPGTLFSPKRTFDLCLFSDAAILIIEAKAQQAFEADQLACFVRDRDQVRQETGVERVALVGLASSRYAPPREVADTFDGPLLTWLELAALYGDDPLLARADEVYEPDRSGSWGRNNVSGHMTGEELVAAFRRGECFFVGCKDGLNGRAMANDVATGRWRSRDYETNRTCDALPNRNWFTLEQFCARVVREAQPTSDSFAPGSSVSSSGTGSPPSPSGSAS
jgi:hypothetical protein